MAVDVIVGLQRGDEGKGRFVDMMAGDYDIVARFNGGSNAGHTVVRENGDILKLHQIPSGIVHPEVTNVIGNGTLVDPLKLLDEITELNRRGIKISPDNLKVSSGAHLVLPHHVSLEEIWEAGEERQGTTKSGIAPTAADKGARKGLRTEQIKNNPDRIIKAILKGFKKQRQERDEAGLEPVEDAEEIALDYIERARQLGEFITDTVWFLRSELSKTEPARVLAEGAQAFSLDIEHGMYEFVTSSNTTSGGAITGLGIPPNLDRIIGVTKVVQSHVGEGPFVTEIPDGDELTTLRGDKSAVDAEYGATTGRERRLGYLDLPQLRRANWINGITEMAITKLDWLNRYGDKIPVCVAYTRKGKTIKFAVDSARKLEQCKPQYEFLPAWTEDIQDVKNFGDLPENARAYITFLEQQTSKPISMIGVGPERDQVILREV